MSFWAKDVRNGDLTSNRKPDGDSSSHLPPLPARKSSTNRRAPTFDRELSRSRCVIVMLCDNRLVLRWRGVLSETRWETSSLMLCYGRDCARVVPVVGCTDPHAPSVHPPSSPSVPFPRLILPTSSSPTSLLHSSLHHSHSSRLTRPMSSPLRSPSLHTSHRLLLIP